MANRIKGITVEIGGDTTKLSKALEGVNRDIKGTQTQLKDVQKLLKLDPTNTELLSQKHKLLADAVSATKEKLEVLKTAAEQANTALANGEISQQQYDALQREIIETENELKRLRITSTDLMEQLRLANCPSLSDVQYAIMESNGQLTVIPKAENKPLTPKDMQLTVSEGALPMLIISDGKLYEKNLHALGINKNALDAKLQNASLSDYRKIFLAFYDENKQIHVYLHNERTSPFAAEVIL